MKEVVPHGYILYDSMCMKYMFIKSIVTRKQIHGCQGLGGYWRGQVKVQGSRVSFWGDEKF